MLILLYVFLPSCLAESRADQRQLFDTEIKRKIINAPALDLPPVVAKKVAFFPLSSAEVKEEPWSDAITELFSF